MSFKFLSTPDIPYALSVYESESMVLPPSVDYFIILIPNEAHESWKSYSESLLTDHNQFYIPTNLQISHGTSILFMNVDTPWDNPHPHTINIIDVSGEVVYTTGKMDYLDSSEPKILPVGKYDVINTENETGKGTILVREEKKPNYHGSGFVLGGFYTPTYEVKYDQVRFGNLHPGCLGYYKTVFPMNGFTIMSQHNFSKYVSWPTELWYIKPRDQTLIIYKTDQRLSTALIKLKKMVRDNAYVSDIRFEEVTAETYEAEIYKRHALGCATSSKPRF